MTANYLSLHSTRYDKTHQNYYPYSVVDIDKGGNCYKCPTCNQIKPSHYLSYWEYL